jgi:hypothetical protein
MCELMRHGMAEERHGNGMGAVWARHVMCELTQHGMAGERHGRGTACVNYPLFVR